jgi:hypothetical protein
MGWFAFEEGKETAKAGPSTAWFAGANHFAQDDSLMVEA